jgi:predicted small lipoprotein YifL
MPALRVALLCALTLLVVTCGQKGPLYLPDRDADIDLSVIYIAGS